MLNLGHTEIAYSHSCSVAELQLSVKYYIIIRRIVSGDIYYFATFSCVFQGWQYGTLQFCLKSAIRSFGTRRPYVVRKF